MEKKKPKLPVRTKGPKAKSFRDELPENQRKKFDELAGLMKSPRTGDLRWWREVGEIALKLQPRGERQYGERFIGRMAVALGEKDVAKKTANRLYQARQLASSFSGKEIEALQDDITNRRLLLRHVVGLSRAPVDHRQKLLNACRKQRWTIQQLERAIHAKLGYRRGAGGHRLHPPPKDQPLPVVVRDVTNLIRGWQTYAAVWLAEKEGSLRQKPTTKHERQLRKELDRALARLSGFENSIKEVGQRLRELNKATRSTKQPSRKTPSRSEVAKSKSARRVRRKKSTR